MNRRRSTSRRTNTNRDSRLELANSQVAIERQRSDSLRARLEEMRPAMEAVLTEWGLSWGDVPPRRLVHTLSNQTIYPELAEQGRFLEEYRVLLRRLKDAKDRIESASHLFRQSSPNHPKPTR